MTTTELFANSARLSQLMDTAVAVHGDRQPFHDAMEELLTELVERAEVILPVDRRDGQVLANSAADGKQVLLAFVDAPSFTAYADKFGAHITAAPVPFATIAQAFATSPIDGLVLTNQAHNIFIDRTQIEHCSRAVQTDVYDDAATGAGASNSAEPSPEQAMTVLAEPTSLPDGLCERLREAAAADANIERMWMRATVQNKLESPALLVQCAGSVADKRAAHDRLWAAVKDLFAPGASLAIISYKGEDDPLLAVGDRDPMYARQA